MPSAEQRRLLVELLASELDGDGTVLLNEPGREVACEELLGSGMLARVGTWIALTRAGRELATGLADRMLGAKHRIHIPA